MLNLATESEFGSPVKHESGNVKVSTTQRLVESAVLLAMAVVLSVLKLFELPYGGSVTVASMFPVMLIAYRHGLGYGLISATVFGGIQQLFGLKNLSYVSSWQSVLAVIMLDYIVAFAVIGFGGSFRKRFGSNQALQLVCGSLLVCLLRYACHVVSGATVWAGLSIPTKAALAYSLAYNATYMVPETIVLVTVAYFLGNSLNFRLPTPVRVNSSKQNRIPVFTIIGLFIAAAAVIADVALIFSKLQDAETGNWNIHGFSEVNWILVAVITGIGFVAAVALIVVDRRAAKRAAGNE